MGASWPVQLGATVFRNFLLKLRDGNQTLQEIFLPVYIIVLLILLKLVQLEADVQGIPMSPEVNATCVPVGTTTTASICFDAHQPRGTMLAYAPDHPALQGIMQAATSDLATLYPGFSTVHLQALASSYDVSGFYEGHPGEVVAAVVFDVDVGPDDPLPETLSFAIRINGSEMPPVGLEVAGKDACRGSDYQQDLFTTCQSQKYLTSGFLALQTSVTRAISRSAWKGSVCESQADTLITTAIQMPLPPYYRSFASVKFELFTAMYMVWALIPVLQSALTQIVQEKETLLKDCMLLMGLKETVYWLSWTLTYAATSLLTSLVLAGAAKLTTLFQHSTVWAVLAVIYPYCLSLVAMAMALSALFTQTQKAGAVAGLLLLLGSLLIVPIRIFSWPAAVVYPLMLFSPVSFAVAISAIVKGEGAAMGSPYQGLNWQTLWSTRLGTAPGDPPNSCTVGACIISFVVDTVLYLFLAWYLDNVWPHPERGAKKHPAFILSFDYWFPPSARRNVLYTQLGPEHILDDEDGDEEAAAHQAAASGSGPAPASALGVAQSDVEDENERAPINLAASSSALDASEAASSGALAVREKGAAALEAGPRSSTRPPALVLQQLERDPSVAQGGMPWMPRFSFWPSSWGAAAAPFPRRSSSTWGWGRFGERSTRRRHVRGGLVGQTVGWLLEVFASGPGAGLEAQAEPLRPLSLDIQAGEIFAVLGHAGSGKSTVLGMLQGLLQPTAGEAFFHGLSLTRGDSFLHSLAGVCPPTNLGLPFLTVREQLRFFAAIKGKLEWVGPSKDRSPAAPGAGPAPAAANGVQSEVEPEGGAPGGAPGLSSVDSIMWALGLQGWADRPAYELSASQMRKLTVAIALVGNPEMLFLDEPTAGMDEASRKQVWDILREQRPGRVVVVGTHSMEEADNAADRTAILSHGQLKCCGSSLFLRTRFGLSYLLHVRVKRGPQGSGDTGPLLALLRNHVMSAAVCVTQSQRLTQRLSFMHPQPRPGTAAAPLEHSPQAGGSDASGADQAGPLAADSQHALALVPQAATTDITIRLPLTQAASSLGPLLLDLWRNASALGVEDAAVEATTLEEVFMRFQDEGEDEAGFVPGDASEGNEGKGPEEAAELWRKWPQREGAGEENRGLLMHAQDDQEGLQVAGAPQAPPAQLQVHQDLEARETVTPRGGEAWEEQATASGSALPSDVPVVDRDGVARPSGTQGAPGQGEEKAPMSWANPWARKGSLAQRQTGALLSIRFTAYRRQMGSTLGTFGLPVVLTLTALLIQGLTMSSHDYSAPVPLAADAGGAALGQDVPIFYTTADPGDHEDAHQLLQRLGGNHAFLDAAHFQERFTSALENTATNGAGLAGVGIFFHDIQTAACRLHYAVVHQPWHVNQLPSMKAVLDSTFLQAVAENHSIAGTPKQISVSTYPLFYQSLPLVLGFFLAFIVSTSLLLVPPVLAAQVVLERETGIRHLLLRVNGMRGGPFWAATITADCICFWACAAVVALIGLLFDRPPFTLVGLPLLVVLLGVAVPSVSLFCYVLSFNWVRAQSAASVLTLHMVLLSFFPYIIVLGLPASAFTVPHAVLCCLDPPYALLAGLHFLAAYTSPVPPNPFLDPEVVGSDSAVVEYFASHKEAYPVLVAILGLAASALGLLLRLWQLQREREASSGLESGAGDLAAMMGPQTEDGDDEVLNERDRVQHSAAAWDAQSSSVGAAEGDLILCSSLGKNHGATSGVCGIGREPGSWVLRNLWLGVRRGEVLVLVGGEGSGKSTLVSCLAGATPASYGDALVNGVSVRYSHHQDPTATGFCPQREALYPFLTVREHVLALARIRGVAEPVGPVVDSLLESLQLKGDADSRIGSSKASVVRRVAVAISLLGNPSVLLLDEPCQGVDSASRHVVWQRILAEASTRATLICTHSVEEAEALGTRVGVLLRGRLLCLGSPQSLKSRYGSSYTLSLAAPLAQLPHIRRLLASLFPPPAPAPQALLLAAPPQSTMPEGPEAVAAGAGTEIALSPSLEQPQGNKEGQGTSHGVEQGLASLRLQVPVQGLEQLARLVETLEANKVALGIREYSVSQPTLQQVFHTLALGEEREVQSAPLVLDTSVAVPVFSTRMTPLDVEAPRP